MALTQIARTLRRPLLIQAIRKLNLISPAAYVFLLGFSATQGGEILGDRTIDQWIALAILSMACVAGQMNVFLGVIANRQPPRRNWIAASPAIMLPVMMALMFRADFNVAIMRCLIPPNTTLEDLHGFLGWRGKTLLFLMAESMTFFFMLEILIIIWSIPPEARTESAIAPEA